MLNFFWGPCLCVTNAAYLIGEEPNVAMLFDAALQGLKRRKMHVLPPLIWMKDGYRVPLGVVLCQNGVYGEDIIRNRVGKIQVFDTYVLIFHTDESQKKRYF